MRCAHFLIAVWALLGFVSEKLAAQAWMQTSAPTNLWSSVACSADGSKVIAAGAGSVWISTNSGITWATNGTASGDLVACSADGVRLVAVPLRSQNRIWSSTDGGNTWMVSTSTMPWDQFGADWRSIACSGEGAEIFLAGEVMAKYGGYIYASTNSGLNWNATSSPTTVWFGVACSAEGRTVLGVSSLIPAAGWCFMSQDSGATWTATGLPFAYWSAVTCSADATTVMATDTSGNLYVSTDSGTNWAPRTPPGQSLTSPLAVSADGTKLFAVSGSIFTSENFGVTWVSNNLPALSWSSIASSADGHKLFATASNGGLYTLQTIPTPTLSIAPSSQGGLLLSWIVPSQRFVLQQSSNLRLASWANVSVSPALNLTNLHNEVSAPLLAGRVFYRLLSQ